MKKINTFNEIESNDFLYEESLSDINKSFINFNSFNNPIPPFKEEDLFQNDTQYSNRLYFKSDKEKPLLSINDNNIIKDNLNFRKDKNENKEKKENEKMHTKYSDDNMRRKCKVIILNHLLDFINKKIKEKYDNIGYGVNVKKLMKINKNQVTKSNINYNIKFMKKTLQEIFSDDISLRYTSYAKDKNKNLIKKLMEEKEYFKNIFNLTFLDCLHHFINKKFIPELKDLELFEDIINDSDKLKLKKLDINDKDYLDNIRDYLENYEKILLNKKSRKPKREKNTKKNKFKIGDK